MMLNMQERFVHENLAWRDRRAKLTLLVTALPLYHAVNGDR
jgi:hypothetical protein